MTPRRSAPAAPPTRRVDVEARAPQLSDDALGELADVFGLLADRGRLRLLGCLLESSELCVGDLAAASGLNDSSASHALRLLRAHRVVHARRSGRMSYYRLADSHVRLLLEVAMAHVGHDDAAVVGPSRTS